MEKSTRPVHDLSISASGAVINIKIVYAHSDNPAYKLPYF